MDSKIASALIDAVMSGYPCPEAETFDYDSACDNVIALVEKLLAEAPNTQPTENEVRRAITTTFAKRREIGEDWFRAVARAFLALLPGRPESVVKEEALREAADELDRMYFGPDQNTPFTTGAKHKWGATQAAKRLRARIEATP